MVRKYHFTDDTWWDNPGCDCCDHTEMPAYNSGFTGTLQHEDQILPEALSHFILHKASQDELDAVARLLKIQVYVDGDEWNDL